MNNDVLVTTSWDDGHELDIKLINMLDLYGIKGTFYLSKSTNQLNVKEIKEISARHEVGAHSIGHKRLTELKHADLVYEIEESKKWLEDIIGKKVGMFCYPYGDYNKDVLEIVKQCGFTGARTTQSFVVDKIIEKYLMPVTIQVYPFPVKNIFKSKLNFIFYRNYGYYKNIKEINLPLSSYFSWVNLANNLFEYSKKLQGCFHVWGHSWEIDKCSMWSNLEKLFMHIKQSHDIRFMSNSELLEEISNKY